VSRKNEQLEIDGVTYRECKFCETFHPFDERYWYSVGDSWACKKRYDDKKKEWLKDNPEKRHEIVHKWIERNRRKHNDNAMRWAKNNPAAARAINKRWFERLPEEKKFAHRLRVNLRSRLCQAVRIGSKKGSAVRDLGCSVEEFKKYIESRFQEGMSWDNWGKGHGKWQIDHIRPLAVFDLSDESQVKAACHYTNLQPLWSEENAKKGAKEQ
jgi:hypothetical protein